MTDEPMTDAAEHVNVTSTPTGVGGASILDVTALLGVIGSMFDRTERNILARIDDNSRAATERWRLHDEQLARDRKAVIERFEANEAHIDRVDADVTEHHRQAHEAQLEMQARVQPVKMVAGFLWANWRTILLLIIAVLAVVGLIGDTIHGMLP